MASSCVERTKQHSRNYVYMGSELPFSLHLLFVLYEQASRALHEWRPYPCNQWTPWTCTQTHHERHWQLPMQRLSGRLFGPLGCRQYWLFHPIKPVSPNKFLTMLMIRYFQLAFCCSFICERQAYLESPRCHYGHSLTYQIQIAYHCSLGPGVMLKTT